MAKKRNEPKNQMNSFETETSKEKEFKKTLKENKIETYYRAWEDDRL